MFAENYNNLIIINYIHQISMIDTFLFNSESNIRRNWGVCLLWSFCQWINRTLFYIQHNYIFIRNCSGSPWFNIYLNNETFQQFYLLEKPFIFLFFNPVWQIKVKISSFQHNGNRIKLARINWLIIFKTFWCFITTFRLKKRWIIV